MKFVFIEKKTTAKIRPQFVLTTYVTYTDVFILDSLAHINGADTCQYEKNR